MVWHVYDRETKEKRKLSVEEATAFILDLSHAKLNQILVWKAGFAEWLELSKCPELLSLRSAQTGKVAAASERRKDPRIEIRLRVIVSAGNLVFRSFTKNVSAGGLALEHDLPEAFLGLNLDLFLSRLDNKASLKFNAILVPESAQGRGFRFKDSDAKTQTTLKIWLENEVEVAKTRVA